MKRAAILLAACTHGSAAIAPPATSGPVAPATPMQKVDTRVITFAAGETRAVMVGPFLVTTINPGGVVLAISPDGRCDDITWFDYSGGGVAVPPYQTLCARGDGVEAFSGYIP